MDVLITLIILLVVLILLAYSSKYSYYILGIAVLIWLILIKMSNVKETFDNSKILDIYAFEHTLSDTKYRNKDAWPIETDGVGPVLGPQWAVDNSDIVNDTLDYSRGVYAFDPITKREFAFNAESFSVDDGMARRQEWTSSINKRAIDGTSRSTRNIYDKHFIAELADNEEREWWGGEVIAENDRFPY